MRNSERGGAALAAWVAGRLICSVYLAPHVEAQSVADAVTEMMLSIPQRTSWLLGGDFNATPSEHVLIRALENPLLRRRDARALAHGGARST